jgi:hypothetical protein
VRQVPSKHLQAGFDSRHPLRRARRSAADRRDDTPEARRFDPCRAHEVTIEVHLNPSFLSRSSSGLGLLILDQATRVRFPHAMLD